MIRARTTRASLSPIVMIVGFVLVIGATILVLTTESVASVYLIIIPLFIISLINFEYNVVLLLAFLNIVSSHTGFLHETSRNYRWVMLGLLASKAVLPVAKKGKLLGVRGIHVGFGLFCLAALLSVIDSPTFKISLYRTISLWLMYIAVFWACWRYYDSREKVVVFVQIWQYIAGVFIVLGLGMALSGIGNAYFGARFRGFYFNPNTLGLLATMYIPLAYLMVISKEFNKKNIWRTIHILLFGAALLSLLLSASRAAIAGLFIGGVFYLGIRYQSRAIIYVAIFLALGGVFYSVIEQISETTFFQAVLYRKTTIEVWGGRKEIWEQALELYRARPIFGYGFGSSELVLASKGDLSRIAEIETGIQTHNSLLRMLVEMGWIGMVFSGLFLISFISVAHRLIKKAPSKELFEIVTVMLVGIIAGLVDSLFESWVMGMGNLICVPYWIIVMFFYRMDYRIEDFVKPGDTPLGNIGLFSKGSRR